MAAQDLPLTSTAFAIAPVAPILIAPAGVDGVKFPNDGRVALMLKTTGAVVATFKAKRKYADGTFKDVIVTLPPSSTLLVGPVPSEFLVDGLGKTEVSFDTVAGLTVAAVKIG